MIRVGFLQLHVSGAIGLVLSVGMIAWSLWLNSTDDGLEFNEKIDPIIWVIYVVEYLLFLLIGIWLATKGFTHNPLKP